MKCSTGPQWLDGPPTCDDPEMGGLCVDRTDTILVAQVSTSPKKKGLVDWLRAGPRD